MAKIILICVLIALTYFSSCYARPRTERHHLFDANEGHEVEEMTPDEQLEHDQVESTNIEEIVPAPEVEMEVAAFKEVAEYDEEHEIHAAVPVPAPDVAVLDVQPPVAIDAPVEAPEEKFRSGKYTVHPLRKAWAEATEYCRNDNKHLVRLDTSMELRTVLAHFPDGITQVWTDGIGDLKGKKYLWATTGDLVDITEMETVKAEEDLFPKALVLERKGLVGAIQTTRLPFICES